MSYQAYLASPEWKHLRAQARQRAGHQCEHCGGSPDHVHHVRYPKNLKDDVLENLIVVCESCHMKHHGIRGKKMGTAISKEVDGIRLVFTDYNGQKVVSFESVIDYFYGARQGENWQSKWRRAKAGLMEDVHWVHIENNHTNKIEPFLFLAGIAIVGVDFGTDPDKVKHLKWEMAEAWAREKQETRSITTTGDFLYEAAKKLRDVERQQLIHESKIAKLEDDKQDVWRKIKNTVAAPGLFTVRQYLLMRDLNPESEWEGRKLKELIGYQCGKIGRHKGVIPGKVVEGTYKPNAWPANIIDEALEFYGIE